MTALPKPGDLVTADPGRAVLFPGPGRVVAPEVGDNPRPPGPAVLVEWPGHGRYGRTRQWARLYEITLVTGPEVTP